MYSDISTSAVLTAAHLQRNTGLEVNGVSKSYPTAKGAYTAIEHINLEVKAGEFVSLIGHSGCGKSTLLSLIAGLELPSSGRLRFNGLEITAPDPDRAVVFQNYSLLPWLNVYQNVSEALEAARPNLSALDTKARVEIFLRAVNLWQHKDKRPSELSGGMKQRVAIARAFATHPKMLLLDEPFGALDALTRGSLQDKLNQMWSGESGVETVVMVTHDIDEALYLSDRIVVMSNGPKARIQEILEVPFARPRPRAELSRSSEYTALREKLMYLLTEVLGKH
jgi:nitrate/nitrite transport system ATP-binding protein